MKTSQQQYDLMLTYMEQHGDLSKPSSHARGRMVAIQRWEELKSVLNSDGSGDTKTTEKWKKVWSDFKNNTKKKAARLHRAASGTGGGPAVYSKLTDLEQRALSIIGIQTATGLAIEEAGFFQEIHNEPTVPVDAEQTGTQETGIDMTSEPGPSSRAEPVTLHSEAYLVMQDAEHVEQAFTSVVCTPAPLPTQDHEAESVPRVRPARSGQSSPRRARRTRLSPHGARRSRGSPRRLVRPAHTEQAAQHFLHSDAEWREFKKQQHSDYMEIKREQNRIREMELQEQSRIREMELRVQQEWQAVGLRVLDLVDKYLSK